MKKNARSAAYYALIDVDLHDGYSNKAIDSILKEFSLSENDSSLATAIFYGVIEKEIILDSCIEIYLNNPNKKLNPRIREIVRIALYQILFMEKIPESAAVNESVSIAKELKLPYSFVNALLRSIVRDKSKMSELLTSNKASLKYSIPEELINMWINAYGSKITGIILNSTLTHSKTWIRINTLKVDNDQFIKNALKYGESTVYQFLNGSLEIKWNRDISKTAEYIDGWFHVQDISSQLYCSVISPSAGDNVLDVCAAPGGKSFTLCEMMGNNGHIVAADKYPEKVRMIEEGKKRLGLSAMECVVRDGYSKESPVIDSDIVLCDVPCSGYGTIKRKPEVRYKNLSAVEDLPNIQYTILDNSAKSVKPGGRLFYSTCTLNPDENNKIADRFISEHDNFKPLEIKIPLGFNRMINEPDNQFTIIPDEYKDGFFIASFKRIR
jgi:16S rRNA (cytosine967-C5)-methyltransferase